MLNNKTKEVAYSVSVYMMCGKEYCIDICTFICDYFLCTFDDCLEIASEVLNPELHPEILN